MALAYLGAAADPPERLTLGQAADRLQDAIDYGKLAAQSAPPGHAIFAAVGRAEDARDQLREMIPWFSSGGPTIGPDMPKVWQPYQAAIDGIYAATATIRTDPARPLPRTNWASIVPSGLPWPWLALAGGVVALTAALFHRRRRRR